VSRGSDEPEDFGFDVDFDFPEGEEGDDSTGRKPNRTEGSRLAETFSGLRRGQGVLTPATIRRRRTAALIGLAALLIFIAVIVAVLAGGDGGETAEPASPTPPAAESPTPAPAPATPVEPVTPSPPQFEEGTVLRPGDSGEAVRSLQEALGQLGYEVGEPDGEYGPATEAAVAAFQADQGLADDGVAGTQTLEAIEQALAAG
jgi:hypothetical protein